MLRAQGNQTIQSEEAGDIPVTKQNNVQVFALTTLGSTNLVHALPGWNPVRQMK